MSLSETIKSINEGAVFKDYGDSYSVTELRVDEEAPFKSVIDGLSFEDTIMCKSILSNDMLVYLSDKDMWVTDEHEGKLYGLPANSTDKLKYYQDLTGCKCPMKYPELVSEESVKRIANQFKKDMAILKNKYLATRSYAVCKKDVLKSTHQAGFTVNGEFSVLIDFSGADLEYGQIISCDDPNSFRYGLRFVFVGYGLVRLKDTYIYTARMLPQYNLKSGFVNIEATKGSVIEPYSREYMLAIEDAHLSDEDLRFTIAGAKRSFKLDDLFLADEVQDWECDQSIEVVGDLKKLSNFELKRAANNKYNSDSIYSDVALKDVTCDVSLLKDHRIVDIRDRDWEVYLVQAIEMCMFEAEADGLNFVIIHDIYVTNGESTVSLMCVIPTGYARLLGRARAMIVNAIESKFRR